MRQNIFVLHVPANDADPCVVKIVDRDKMSVFEALVGGHVEQVTVNAYVVAHFHEEGFRLGLPFNRRASMILAAYGFTNHGSGFVGNITFLSQVRDNRASVSAVLVQLVSERYGLGGPVTYEAYQVAMGAPSGSNS